MHSEEIKHFTKYIYKTISEPQFERQATYLKQQQLPQDKSAAAAESVNSVRRTSCETSCGILHGDVPGNIKRPFFSLLTLC